MGCGEGGSDYDLSWLMGASSTFEATTEGAVTGSMAGTATFRQNDEGELVGIELVHIDDSSRGMSIELEPRPVETRTYTVLPPQLMGAERTEGEAGFTAFFQHAERHFQAARGTLRVTEASASAVRGTFVIDMEGQRTAQGGVVTGDVTVRGSFDAARIDD